MVKYTTFRVSQSFMLSLRLQLVACLKMYTGYISICNFIIIIIIIIKERNKITPPTTRVRVLKLQV